MRKNMKKTIILSGILCMLLLCGCGGDDDPKETPANTPAPSTELTAETLKDYPESPVSDFEFEEDADGNVTLRAYNGSDEVVVVPSSYEGKPVKYIAPLAFGNGCTAKAVKLPDSIEEIQESAFGSNKNLQIVVFGENTKKISKNAFLDCSSLRELDLNEGLEEIEYPFMFCEELNQISVPKSVSKTSAYDLYTGSDCTIYGEKGSFIEKEIKENGEEYLLTFEER